MNLFSRFRKLDSSLQRGVDNSFARIFGGAVVPAEIDETLKEEASNALMHDDAGNQLTASQYTVHLSPVDLEKLQEKDPSMELEFSHRLGRFIRNQGWITSAPVTVLFRPAEDLHSGQLKITMNYQPTAPIAQVDSVRPAPAQSASPGQTHSESAVPSNVLPPPFQPTPGVDVPSPAPSASVPHVGANANSSAQPPIEPQLREDTTQADPVTSPGTEIFSQNILGENAYLDDGLPDTASGPLKGLILQVMDGSGNMKELPIGTTVLGRGSASDIRLNDTGVSRQHAEITWDGYDAILTDLQSTNGTTVNETPVENWLLADGDLISMGHTDIAVHFH